MPLETTQKDLFNDRKSIRKGKQKPRRTQAVLDQLAAHLDTMHLPDITPTPQDVKDLEVIDNLTQAQNQLERLKAIETEIVENQKWNHDASQELLNIAMKTKRILFGTRPDGDGATTGDHVKEEVGEGHPSKKKKSSKGKEREETCESPSQFIYNLLPDDAKETLSPIPGMRYSPHPPLAAKEKDHSEINYDDFLEHAFPEFFDSGTTHHNCVYRDLLKKVCSTRIEEAKD